MSAKQLCDALAAAGFDGDGPLDPDSLEWAFLQGDDSRRMLAWVSARLRPGNVISATDLELGLAVKPGEQKGLHEKTHTLAYACFENCVWFKLGMHDLYRRVLEFVHREMQLLKYDDQTDICNGSQAYTGNRCMNCRYEQLEMEGKLLEIVSSTPLSSESDSKLALRAEVSDLEKQLASLEWKLDLLTAQATTITQGKKSRSSAKTRANGQLTGSDERFAKRSLEMNAVLGKLAATTQELSYYHSEADIGVYLSYCDFLCYVRSNLGCTKELNRWFSKKFEKGPLQLVVKDDKSRGDFVNSHHFVVQLNRINSIFAKSKMRYIEAQAEYVKEEAIVSTLRTQLASQQSYIHQDSHSLRRKSSEFAEELKDLSLNVQKCLSETVTGLCADLAQLACANILEGGHNVKLLRQECYISHQKKFINYLVNQLTAHRFLKISCQLEKRAKISSAYLLLKAIELELHSYLSAVDVRLDRYHSIDQAASEMFEEGSVDDRDSFLHAVRDILSSPSSSQAMAPTYVSLYGLVEQISELQDELQYLQHEAENVLPRERGRCTDELCRMVQTLEQILGVLLSDEQPKLTPWPLAQWLEELETVSQQVSASVTDVTLARDQKAEILKQPSRNAQQKRQVFVDFFCRPGRLENEVKELVSRVRGLPE
ncbi:AUGMIN subunit 3-like isoform X1 [Panicum miliaceum]|uniref:AUGMIN subunit 3-like isoform X1 n=1 Tax=Panicum miliaceum TaxID=4540 RepID=A0A3L6TC17_PANMI|nr:AUGMIN subunit 3-like isoform X1 [Panicum miliaceum]